ARSVPQAHVPGTGAFVRFEARRPTLHPSVAGTRELLDHHYLDLPTGTQNSEGHLAGTAHQLQVDLAAADGQSVDAELLDERGQCRILEAHPMCRTVDFQPNGIS